MPIWRGNTLVRAVYRGTTPVLRVFARGGREVWRRDPVAFTVTSGTSSFVAPDYAAFVDIGVIGGGASGATGDNGVSEAAGTGAPAAVWQTVTVAVKPGQQFDYTVGTGGAAKNGVKQQGNPGAATTVSSGGSTVVTSPGSVSPTGNTANNNRTGRGAVASSINGLVLPGSADAVPSSQTSTEVDGNPPGGGGSGGQSLPWTNSGSGYYSGDGGRGELRYQFRSY